MNQVTKVPALLLIDMIEDNNPYYSGIIRNPESGGELVGVQDWTDTQDGILLTWKNLQTGATYTERVNEHDHVRVDLDIEAMKPALIDELA